MIKAFKYIPELDCFVVRGEFTKLVERLGLAEWTPVVWMGRLFRHDQDYGEHWSDNWDQRESVAQLAKEKGLEHLLGDENSYWHDEVLGPNGDFACIVLGDSFYERNSTCLYCKTEAPREIPCPNPDCMKAQPEWATKPREKHGTIHIRPDGPCHSDEIRKLFWTDVLKSLHVSLDTLFALARDNNENEKKYDPVHGRYKADLEDRIATIKQEYSE